jgi:calcium/proton exchanger cax
MGFLLGGLRLGRLRFDREEAGRNSTVMLLALGGMTMPTAFAITDSDPDDTRHVSVSVSVVLIVLHVLCVVYSLANGGPEREQAGSLHPAETSVEVWSTRLALGVLLAATAATVVLAELLGTSVMAALVFFFLSA